MSHMTKLISCQPTHLIKIDNTITNIIIKRTLQGRTTTGNGSIMTSTNIQLIVILYKYIYIYIYIFSKNCQYIFWLKTSRFLYQITFKRRGQLEVSIAGAEAVGLITDLSAIVVILLC